ncbi:hypothetical protein AXF42_Ash010539 [Apostasia shenzhenica]|uniref:Protein MIZU-KUSSEI 1 n=1 Tax=Apostasia shenzhenica TaxID=1088818 RepID=A0A2I0A6E0_9ASPA|nr:hypothetical protein AXF42_Ash010539 [Apostasia shenzhenica]
MRIMDLRRQGGGPLQIIETATAVDCTKDVRLRRSFRSMVECMIPFCCGLHTSSSDLHNFSSSTATSFSVVTGTFFGRRRSRVSFCLQDSPRAAPLLLLEFAVPTSFLAREMSHGLLRIALEYCSGEPRGRPAAAAASASLFSVPAWAMYCNGRKVGFAVRRKTGESDLAMLKTMQSVSVGAGVLPESGSGGSGGGGCGEMMYLRARYERVIGSVDCESFHMINPLGSTGQELSIFFFRS